MILGFQAEESVICSLKNQGWHFATKRWRTPWAEIDLIFYRQGIILLVEVKKIKRHWLSAPLSKTQCGRLKRAWGEMAEIFLDYQVWFWMALVDEKEKILILKDW